MSVPATTASGSRRAPSNTTTTPRRSSAPHHTCMAWASRNGITIQPSSTSIPPDRSLTLSTGTAYYIWNASTPSPPYTPSATRGPSIASDMPSDLNESRQPSQAGSHFPAITKKGIVIIQHGWSEYARRWMERNDGADRGGKARKRSRYRYEDFYFCADRAAREKEGGSQPEEEEVLSLGACLRDEGWEIWAMDLWGHGGSPPPMRPDGSRNVSLSMRRCVKDFRELVEKAKAGDRNTSVGKDTSAETSEKEALSSDGDKVFVLGHGLGGLVAIGNVLNLGRRARSHVQGGERGRVDGVILSAPAIPQASVWTRAGLSIAAFFAPDSAIWQKKKDLNGLSRLKAQVSAFEQDPLRFDGHVTFQTANSSLKLASKVWRRLGEWETPVLLFHGTADTWTAVDDSREFYDRVQVRDKCLEEVEGGRHELLRDLGHGRLVKQIVTWLDQRSQDPQTTTLDV